MEVLYQSEPSLNPTNVEAEEFLPDDYVSGEDIFPPDDPEETGTEPTADPTKDAPMDSRKLTFTARVDHKDIRQEIDEAELPDLYQKAQVTERVQAKLARQTEALGKAESLARRLGFSTAEEMINAADSDYKEQRIRELTDKGTPRVVAESYVNQSEIGKSGEKAADTPRRDFLAELRELVSERPELGSGRIPDSVTQRALSSGRSLLVAYAEYERDQALGEIEKIRNENRIMKQNQTAAQRAPVKGAAGGGGAVTGPRDPFLAGFDADRW